MKRRIRSLGALALAVVLSAGVPLAGAESEITVYAWGTNISGDATLNQRNASFEADFDDLVDKLEFGFMGHFETRGDTWGGGVDLVFTELEDQNNGLKTTVDFGILEGFATYRVNERFDVIAGIRQTSIEVDVDVAGQRAASGDGDLTDGFAGGRVTVPLSPAWSLVVRADAGAGDSDLVLNGLAILRWAVTDSFLVSAGYRVTDYDFEGDTLGTDFDMTLDGFLAGVSYRF